MNTFDDYSLAWLLLAIGLIALAMILRAWLGYRAVAQDAETDYAYKKDEGMIDKRLSKDGYIRAYKRYYAPRKPVYMGFGFLAVLVLTPLAMMLFSLISAEIWKLAGRPEDYAPQSLVWQFMYFFALIAMWGLIAYGSATLYYRNAPRTLRDEMLKEMD